MSDQAKDRMPWAFSIGLALAGVGLIGLLAGEHPGLRLLGILGLLIGMILLATGLIQRSIEKSRRP